MYPADELAALATVCGELDLDLVTDEIYANSVFGDAPYLGDAAGRVFGHAVGIAGRLKPF